MIKPCHVIYSLSWLQSSRQGKCELQMGNPTLYKPPLETDYVLLVNRAGTGDIRLSEIWPVALNEPLPLLPVPLFPSYPDVPLDLGAALESVYSRAGYDWRIDYKRAVPLPKLRAAMEGWLRQARPRANT